MFLFSLLSVSDTTTKTVTIVSVIAAIILLSVIALLCLKGKNGAYRYETKHIAFAGVALGASFVLSYLKVSPVLYGGSITLASFVPVLLYAYVFGAGEGLLVGVIFGLLNFLSGPYILTPMTFVLDYLLAFASIAVMGFFGKGKLAKNSAAKAFVLGTVAVYLLRFIAHLCSGFIYFAQDAIWVEFPAWAVSSAFLYSFIYQCVYIPADCAIACVAGFALAKTNMLTKIQALMKNK